MAKCFRRSPEFLGPDDLMQDEDLGEILADGLHHVLVHADENGDRRIVARLRR